MTVDNGVILLPDGLPVKMRFSAMRVMDGMRRDAVTGYVSSVKRFSAQVIELNGRPIMEVFDTLSEKLWQQLLPYASDPNLSQKQFTITKTGQGYTTQYTVAIQ